ncbi:ENA1 [Candida oxycetoniae]|uniref:P-type Na(+) transporter n=1 Tax=Candida oxycetoniae TaxID=497107 RepID=A0AAI9T0H0_9ASCO|nr:ENA1 [Candida oxycetoniae]KAI3406591.2 ENA1 [Candida oxycetoniae]
MVGQEIQKIQSSNLVDSKSKQDESSISQSYEIQSSEKQSKNKKHQDELGYDLDLGLDLDLELESESPYKLSIQDVASLYDADIVHGLTEDQAATRLGEYGPNNLGKEISISITKILAHQIFNAMILVLIISMIIALAIKDWISGGVIGFVIGINIFAGFIQEFKAEKTMGSLRSLSSPDARVKRCNSEQNIDAEKVVPGDIVFIKVGDTVPADLRLIETVNLESDESMLTGESIPVAKACDEICVDNEQQIPIGDRLNMVFSSSIVVKGRGVGIAVATGLNSEIGKIADSLKNSDGKLIVTVKEPSLKNYTYAIAKSTGNIICNILGTNVGTPLQRRLAWLVILLFWIAVLFAIVVMASQKMNVNRNVAIYAICVALSMIPSSLVVVLTITMAIGAQVMFTKKVIVRKLGSLETLGGINDICSDKTGTLTLGKMITKKVWIPNLGTLVVENSSNEPFNHNIGSIKYSKMSPVGIENDGDILEEEVPENSVLLKKWLTTATLANIANVTEVNGEWEARGDPTEIAINVFTRRLKFERDCLISSLQLNFIAEFPFDSLIKRMSTIYENPESNTTTIYCKGAVERLFDICSFWYEENDKISPLSNSAKQIIESNMKALSAQGLRVLAFAQRDINTAEVSDLTSRDSVETGLTFLGLVGIYDPPRPESRSSVMKCHHAGINVHMLTGDHPGTARAIAQEVGILPANSSDYSQEVIDLMVMTANQFDGLTVEEIDQLPVLPLVIARCAPQTKVRMIEALHRRNRFVAMTGDGVNDSPSLSKADVGIAMGLNGSDVAKDAADIVLTDDNFASILNAIEEGRRMSSNIQKFVLQLLAENVAQAIYLMVGLVFIDNDGFSVFPLSPVEVLWIIVVTSCFPAMGLGQEKAQQDILDQPPNKSIFTWEVMIDMFSYGIWMAACCLACFVVIVYGKGDGYLGSNCNSESGNQGCLLVFQGRSGAFAAFTWCALLLAWECINLRRSFFKMNISNNGMSWYAILFRDLWGNQFLFWSIIFGFCSVFPVVYIPVINDKVFLHGPIGYEWGVAGAFTVAFLIGSEAWKWCKRVYLRRNLPKNFEYELEKKDPFQKYKFKTSKSAIEV